MINSSRDDIDWESMLRAQNSDYSGTSQNDENSGPMICAEQESYENDMSITSMLQFRIRPKPTNIEDCGNKNVHQKSEKDSSGKNEK